MVITKTDCHNNSVLLNNNRENKIFSSPRPLATLAAKKGSILDITVEPLPLEGLTLDEVLPDVLLHLLLSLAAVPGKTTKGEKKDVRRRREKSCWCWKKRKWGKVFPCSLPPYFISQPNLPTTKPVYTQTYPSCSCEQFFALLSFFFFVFPYLSFSAKM